MRKMVRWGALSLAVFGLAVWTVSFFYEVLWRGSGGVGFGIASGSFVVERVAPEYVHVELVGWDAGMPMGERLWWPAYSRTRGFGLLAVPLWMPPLAFGIIAAVGWRLDVRASRRAKSGACVSCGYSRAGLKVEAVCPECGARG